RRDCDRSRVRGVAGDEPCTQVVREGRARFARRRRRESRLCPRVASADRGDGRGAPFRPGRFAGRDRAGHRRLDVEVVDRSYLKIPELRMAVVPADRRAVPSSTAGSDRPDRGSRAGYLAPDEGDTLAGCSMGGELTFGRRPYWGRAWVHLDVT